MAARYARACASHQPRWQRTQPIFGHAQSLLQRELRHRPLSPRSHRNHRGLERLVLPGNMTVVVQTVVERAAFRRLQGKGR
jgi:hypothetical protein